MRLTTGPRCRSVGSSARAFTTTEACMHGRLDVASASFKKKIDVASAAVGFVQVYVHEATGTL